MPRKSPTHSAQQVHTEAGLAAAQQRKIPSEQAVYKSRRWAQLRARVLRQQPWCADPLGWHAAVQELRPAVQVDHIVPLRQRPELAYVRSNLQGLCHQCHAKKTHGQREQDCDVREGVALTRRGRSKG